MEKIKALKKELNQEFSSMIQPKRFSAPHLLAISTSWLFIVGVLSFATWMDSVWVWALSLPLVAGTQHGLMILMHEGAHHHISKNSRLNEWISDLFCAWPVLLDTRLYRANHLKHHLYLSTEKDPDWIRKKDLKEWRFPQTRSFFFMELGKMALWKGPREWMVIARLFFDNKSKVKAATKSLLWLTFGILAAVFPLLRPAVFAYSASLLFVFPIFQRVRSIAEHFGLEDESEINMTRDIKGTFVESFFFYPFGVGLHLSHHMFPQVPFYQLKKVHARLKESCKEKELTPHMNNHFFFGSKSVLKDLTKASTREPVRQKPSLENQAS
ncbi:MAG TPA: hypothetical protein DCL41_05825 [Bdellovibrionales bacterium]|nr:hypothetical protein [Pseudobdellovibrionaceae bacterium]HAG91368.1 hypothetical protein [Bdellovibrionales bacterium]|tara:strand:- start:136 stop:1113 length:978 start_codon:yes stop_codon:yes gene_type:complete